VLGVRGWGEEFYFCLLIEVPVTWKFSRRKFD